MGLAGWPLVTVRVNEVSAWAVLKGCGGTHLPTGLFSPIGKVDFAIIYGHSSGSEQRS